MDDNARRLYYFRQLRRLTERLREAIAGRRFREVSEMVEQRAIYIELIDSMKHQAGTSVPEQQVQEELGELITCDAACRQLLQEQVRGIRQTIATQRRQTVLQQAYGMGQYTGQIFDHRGK